MFFDNAASSYIASLLYLVTVTFNPGRGKCRLNGTEFILKGHSFRSSDIKMDTGGSRVS